jgi:hypothetical protein
MVTKDIRMLCPLNSCGSVGQYNGNFKYICHFSTINSNGCYSQSCSSICIFILNEFFWEMQNFTWSVTRCQ